jgi:hypothetical protein
VPARLVLDYRKPTRAGWSDSAIQGMRAIADEVDMAVETHVLTATCPKCREPFASALQIDPDTWTTMSLHKGMVERCAHCKSASMFMKRDYYFSTD